jgi:hypothetical protein
LGELVVKLRLQGLFEQTGQLFEFVNAELSACSNVYLGHGCHNRFTIENR